MSTHRTAPEVRVFTATISDSRSKDDDESGRRLVSMLEEAGLRHVRHVIMRDEPALIGQLVTRVANDNEADAIVFSGGTGIGPRDQTYEALESIFEKKLEGFGEAFRRLSWDEIGVASILSRATAGVFNRCLVFSLPGSPKAVELGMRALVVPVLGHAVSVVTGRATHGAHGE
jgi:molybdenum cofactor biosynthesis protein B